MLWVSWVTVLAEFQISLAGQSIRAIPKGIIYRFRVIAIPQTVVFPARTEKDEEQLLASMIPVYNSQELQSMETERNRLTWSGVTPDIPFTPRFIIAVDYRSLPEWGSPSWLWELYVSPYAPRLGMSRATLRETPEITYVILDPIPRPRESLTSLVKRFALSFSPLLLYAAATTAAPVVLPLAQQKLAQHEKTKVIAPYVPSQL